MKLLAKPAVSADSMVLSVEGKKLSILLIKRKGPPFQGMWAFPGGFFDTAADDDIDLCAARELREETGLSGLLMHQFRAYGARNRDPRERVITVAHYAFLHSDKRKVFQPKAGDDAAEARWFSVSELPHLAFDHGSILDELLFYLRGQIDSASFLFELLPSKFTWRELQDVYEAVSGARPDPSNFRKKMQAVHNLIELNEKRPVRSRGPNPNLLCRSSDNVEFLSKLN